MLSKSQITKIGFVKFDGPKDDWRIRYRFEADQTNLILVNDPVTAFYELWDGTGLTGKGKLWQGPLLKPSSLIRKLIKFGNNVHEE